MLCIISPTIKYKLSSHKSTAAKPEKLSSKRSNIEIIVIILVIVFVVINEIVAVIPSQHVIVHVDAAAVSDGISQSVTQHVLGRVVGQSQLEEACLGRWKTVLGLNKQTNKRKISGPVDSWLSFAMYILIHLQQIQVQTKGSKWFWHPEGPRLQHSEDLRVSGWVSKNTGRPIATTLSNSSSVLGSPIRY